jgi:histidinol-phosphate/aromatic aminotransferase/cobyric acid decarboxylase-like protein
LSPKAIVLYPYKNWFKLKLIPLIPKYSVNQAITAVLIVQPNNPTPTLFQNSLYSM